MVFYSGVLSPLLTAFGFSVFIIGVTIMILSCVGAVGTKLELLPVLKLYVFV